MRERGYANSPGDTNCMNLTSLEIGDQQGISTWGG